MPLYEYECERCDKQKDEFRSIADRNAPITCECGGSMKKIIAGYRVIGDLEPYYDDNLQAHIRSKQHRKQVMREQGVSEKFGTNWWTGTNTKRIRRA